MPQGQVLPLLQILVASYVILPLMPHVCGTNSALTKNGTKIIDNKQNKTIDKNIFFIIIFLNLLVYTEYHFAGRSVPSEGFEPSTFGSKP